MGEVWRRDPLIHARSIRLLKTHAATRSSIEEGTRRLPRLTSWYHDRLGHPLQMREISRPTTG
jgi:hypothetical protein